MNDGHWDEKHAMYDTGEGSKGFTHGTMEPTSWNEQHTYRFESYSLGCN